MDTSTLAFTLYVTACSFLAFTLVLVILGARLISTLKSTQVLEERRARRELRRLDVADLISADQVKLEAEVKSLKNAIGFLFHHEADLTVEATLNEFMKEKKIHGWYLHKK